MKKYNSKRNFNKTKEPVGKKGVIHKKLRFVVQHHMSRREHYDLRLEFNGVLLSWAVPKGPSYNPKDKRLAVHVEDHPIPYRNFEGTIPKGEYGGGTVMIWDEGYWECKDDIKKSLKNGSIKFELHGDRLKGKWTLVRFKDDNWLLIKEKDNYNLYKNINEYKTSIKTNRTMKEIEQGVKKVKNSKKDNIVEGIKITSPDKIIIDKPKTTKLDIALYYQKVAKRMLPYLDKRLISVIRCPQGIKGECFFKKHLDVVNDGIGKVNIPNDKGNKEDYYYIKDTSGIISEVQMNSFEIHTWGSKVGSINHPDLLIFDLDPDEGMSLNKIRQGVKDLKSILDELNLVSFLKTSGGKGYHVVVPINRVKTWKKLEEIAKDIAKLMEVKWPDKYVSTMSKEKRKNKIFIDYFRNKKGTTSVAPYSVRARNGAYVSMPISWNELDKVKPNGITMQGAIKRLKRKDPWENIFNIDQ